MSVFKATGSGMDISVKFDMKEANKMLRVSKSIQRQAAASAINDGLKKARTEAKRSMAKELKVKQKYLKPAFKIYRANRRQLWGRLECKPFGIPLEWIGGSQKKSGFKPRAMNIRKHTFEATMPSGHKGVYLRASSSRKRRGGSGGDYQMGPSGRMRRLPIITAFAGNTTRAFNKSHVLNAIKKLGRTTFNNRYIYHAKRLKARNMAR